MTKAIQYPTQEWIDQWIDKYLDEHPNEAISDFSALEEQATAEWWDKQIDKGNPTPFDLSDEQAKAVKLTARVDKPKGERKLRERKPNEDKRTLIGWVRTLFEGMELNGKVEAVSVENPEREITFTMNGKAFSLTLTEHRPPKK